MPRIDISRKTSLIRTARVIQTEGIFDLAPSSESEKRWSIDVDLPEQWNVGLIVGPSGAGKTSFAREALGEHIIDGWEWPEDKAVVDGFPDSATIQEITDALSAVGFSSPPAWLKPYHVLSNGEKFRVDLARTLLSDKDIVVVDEFTSVIDRTVAKVGSTAVQKVVRRKGRKFVAISCHYDILDWLDPDWIIEPHIETFTRRSLRGRPPIDVEIRRVDRKAWKLFKPHHYLTGEINQSARCWVAYVWGEPAVFTSVIAVLGKKAEFRGHRTVVLPDYQGLGLAMVISEMISSAAAAHGYTYRGSTSHPALIGAIMRMKNWEITRMPDIKSAFRYGMDGNIAGRLMMSFRYVGPKMDKQEAEALWNGW